MHLATYTLFAVLSWFLLGRVPNVSPLIMALSYGGWAVGYFLLVSQKRLLSVKLVIFIGILLRFLYIFAPDVLTGDLPRYLWEGHLMRMGINPYVFSPDSSALISLRTTYWHKIEYPHLSAIYPPLAQIFQGVFARSILCWKSFLFVIELLNLFLLTMLIKKHNGKRENIIFYALLPLPIVEITGAGHLEGVMITFFLAALLSRTFLFKGSLLVAGIGIKYVLVVPLGLELLTLLREKRYRDAYQLLIGGVVLGVALLVPYFANLPAIFSSLKEYAAHWRFNDSLLYLTGEIVGVDWTDSRTFQWLKLSLLLLWLLTVLFMFVKRMKRVKLYSYTLASFLFISAVVHPWYGLWFAPLLVFCPLRELLTFAVLLPISYAARFYGSGQVPHTLLLIEYVPVYALILLTCLQTFSLKSSSETK